MIGDQMVSVGGLGGTFTRTYLFLLMVATLMRVGLRRELRSLDVQMV
jgi:hypothetical protein